MENKFQIWLKEFQKATDFDAWGQPIEAADIYSKLSKQITDFTEANRLLLDVKREEEGLSLGKHLAHRAKALSSPDDCLITLAQVKELRPTLSQLVSHLERRQSVIENDENVKQTRFQLRALSLDTGDIESDEEEEHQDWLTELSKEKLSEMESGKSYLTIKIEKVGIKEASTYNSPFIVISTKDALGIELTPNQKTPSTSRIEGNWIFFDSVVQVHKPLEDMPRGYKRFTLL